MPTPIMLQNQLAELRMLIDRDDPVHVEAEAAFAAMVAKIVREAAIGDSVAKRMMRGTAEACDALAEDARPSMSAPPASG
jgi:hypothetical protein